MVKRNVFRLAMCLLVSMVFVACDPEGKKDCSWVLEPEPKLKDQVDEGYIPLCARNRKTMKQDCRLQARLDWAKAVYQRKFRYVDMTIASPGIPRKITKITFCDGNKETVTNE